MKITQDLIRAGESGVGGWNREQLALLGVPWPPLRGWRYRVEGNEISEEDAIEFVALRGLTIKKQKALKKTFQGDSFL